VRVKAPDAKGKLRKLEVSARRGYYMSDTGTAAIGTAGVPPATSAQREKP
jgi:hypothetical protein